MAGAPTRVAPAIRPRELAKANRLLLRQISSQLTFFKFPKSSGRFQCMTSPALCEPVSHMGYCDISEWHVRSARARTPVLMLHLSNPCTEPKGSQPNKTQRHKPKSLGHYITHLSVVAIEKWAFTLDYGRQLYLLL